MRRAAVLTMVFVLAARAFAEGPASPPREPWRFEVLPDQWRAGIPRSKALDTPSPVTRDGRVEEVSLKDTISLALQNNPGIAARRLEPTRQEAAVFGVQGQYDPSLNADVNYTRRETPNASALGGTLTSVVEDRNANLHLTKLFRSSTRLSIDFLNDRLDSNSRFTQLRPQYIPQLGFSIVQPLLRDFGWDFSYLVVRVAERAADAAVAQYEADLANFVEQVIAAYWIVVGTRENVEVRLEAKQLADRTVDENQARVKVGLLPPVSVLEAQADAKSREGEVIQAENALAIARSTLAQLVYYSPDGTFVPRTLEPSEEATIEEVQADTDEALETALARRPEILASAKGVEVQQLNEKIAGNALLPRLDLVGTYGRNGLSGTPRPASFGTSTTFSANPIPGARCISLAPNQGFLCDVPSALPTSPFAGTKGDAYGRLSDFESYAVGLQLQVPFANAVARSQYSQSRIARDQAELNHRDLLSQVTLEVRRTAADIVAGRQRIDTTRVARELAEENLRNQQKRHEVGMATTKDLLDFQTRLTTARQEELQAKIDYVIAVSRWRRAQGQLLEHYQIVIDQPGHRSAPWFARF